LFLRDAFIPFVNIVFKNELNLELEDVRYVEINLGSLMLKIYFGSDCWIKYKLVIKMFLIKSFKILAKIKVKINNFNWKKN